MRESYYSSALVLEHREGGKNVTRFALLRSPADVLDVTPCAVQLHRLDNSHLATSVPVLQTCEAIYFVLPKYLSLSDGMRFDLPQALFPLLTKRVVLVGLGLSERAVELLQARNQSWTVLNLTDQ